MAAPGCSSLTTSQTDSHHRPAKTASSGTQLAVLHFMLLLQLVQKSKALLPFGMPGLDIDVPCPLQNQGIGTPVGGKLQRTPGSGSAVAGRTHQQTGKRQALTRNRSKARQLGR